MSLRRQARGQAEPWEERLGAEEEGELDDPAFLDLQDLQRPRVIAVAGLAGRYCPKAGEPLADPAGITREPRQPAPLPTHQLRMSSRPRSQSSYGGIDCVASSWMSDVSASMS